MPEIIGARDFGANGRLLIRPKNNRRISRFTVGIRRRFSVDDTGTIEVDDAFSVGHSGDGRWRVGVHIAAPAFAFPFGDDGDAAAKKRMLSVIFPMKNIRCCRNLTLPRIRSKKGEARAALSQYFLFDAARRRDGRRALLLGKCFSVR